MHVVPMTITTLLLAENQQPPQYSLVLALPEVKQLAPGWDLQQDSLTICLNVQKTDTFGTSEFSIMGPLLWRLVLVEERKYKIYMNWPPGP